MRSILKQRITVGLIKKDKRIKDEDMDQRKLENRVAVVRKRIHPFHVRSWIRGTPVYWAGFRKYYTQNDQSQY